MVSSVQFGAQKFFNPFVKQAMRFGSSTPPGGGSSFTPADSFVKEISNIKSTWQKRLLDAAIRPFRMFLRPKGAAELFIHMIPGLHLLSVPLFMGKHFLEGLLQVDSFFIQRGESLGEKFNIMKGGISGRTKFGRTLLEAIFQGKAIRP